MAKAESLKEYYEYTNKEVPKDLLNKNNTSGHFNVLKRHNCSVSLPFIRRNYYKICLLDDDAVLETSSRHIHINQPSIFFSTPEIDYGWQTMAEKQKGFICLFSEEYLTAELKSSLRRLNTLFKGNAYPFLFLERTEFDLFLLYFERMWDEYHSSFEYKRNIIQNLLQLVIYQAIKIKHTFIPEIKTKSSGDHIINQFFYQLEKQFPVDSPQNPILNKTPAAFAALLHVHVNHLNHCLRSALGKSTTQIINERIITEAVDLLENTDWNISQIAESLGFGYVQHFTYFFKKYTGETPKRHRSVIF